MAENKIARICWNNNRWRSPSGRQGKSKDKTAYENILGYGHEEWLLDLDKLIDGYHYAFLQPVSASSKNYRGKYLNVYLYSINSAKKQRFWIGCIKNLKVITQEESRRVYAEYEKNGWLEEMEEQLRKVDADIEDFLEFKPEDFFVAGFHPNSIELRDSPEEFSNQDSAVSTPRYRLLDYSKTPIFIRKKFEAGHNRKKQPRKRVIKRDSYNVGQLHYQMQDKIYSQLVERYGEKNVGTENWNTDVAVIDKDGKFIFYEIKTDPFIKYSIRAALGQLLEYSYWPGNQEAIKLIVVSHRPITDQAKRYLKKLRDRFSIEIYYQWFNQEKEILEKPEH